MAREFALGNFTEIVSVHGFALDLGQTMIEPYAGRIVNEPLPDRNALKSIRGFWNN